MSQKFSMRSLVQMLMKVFVASVPPLSCCVPGFPLTWRTPVHFCLCDTMLLIWSFAVHFHSKVSVISSLNSQGMQTLHLHRILQSCASSIVQIEAQTENRAGVLCREGVCSLYCICLPTITSSFSLASSFVLCQDWRPPCSELTLLMLFSLWLKTHLLFLTNTYSRCLTLHRSLRQRHLVKCHVDFDPATSLKETMRMKWELEYILPRDLHTFN